MVKARVLRLGHRIARDIRVTTHCCLVARAFGAEGITVVGEEDSGIKKTIENVVREWGGPFKIEFKKNWRKEIQEAKNSKATVVHLTMYGEPLKKHLSALQKKNKLLVVVGAEKVPREVYKESDYNIAVGGQPHSEIAALAVFLNGLFQGKEKRFLKAKKRILPQRNGKKVFEKD